MIEAVVFFGLINVVFEFVLLGMVPPRPRLRLLGNEKAQVPFHIVIMVFVLWVHWGTVTGTMSAFFSFILSMVTMSLARQVFGYIENDVYHRRIIGYTVAELQSDEQRSARPSTNHEAQIRDVVARHEARMREEAEQHKTQIAAIWNAAQQKEMK